MRTPYLPLSVEPPRLADHEKFWNYCSREELRFQHCSACGRHRHPPSPLCPICHSDRYSWELATDDAELFSYTVVHHPASAQLAQATPYNVAVVAFPLLGSLRMVSNVVDASPDELKIGMPLALIWQPRGAGPRLPLFRKRLS